MQPGKIVFYPQEGYAEQQRLWQGCPTVLCTRGGRVFVGWYTGGTREPSLKNYNLLVKSDDEGMTWSSPLVLVQSVEHKNILAIDIQLWLDPSGRMWLFWTQRLPQYPQSQHEHLELWAIVCPEPDAEVLLWDAPQFIAHGFLRCQPTALSHNRWIICAYDWTSNNYNYTETCDGGKSYLRKNGGEKYPCMFDETMLLVQKDHSLNMLARNGSGRIVASKSTDNGISWSKAKQTNIISPDSRFFISRLRSGRILLIRNLHSTQRVAMTASLSEDDGKSWPWNLTLDPRNTSYPDAAETESGTIYAVHDCGRQSDKEILISKFTEEDILAEKICSSHSYLARLISKAPSEPMVPEDLKQHQAKEDQLLFDEMEKRLCSPFRHQTTPDMILLPE